ALNKLRVAAYIKETLPNPYDKQLHTLTKCVFTLSISYSLLPQIDIQSMMTMQEAAYSLKTHSDDDVSNRSSRQNDHLQRSKTYCQHKWEMKGQKEVKGIRRQPGGPVSRELQ
ncbi:hypothetical protein PAXRUDRAFT_169704, partial [Paxillus rubicundulus Ve08.2h10]